MIGHCPARSIPSFLAQVAIQKPAVEVISPRDRYIQVEGTVFAWLDAGSRMVLVVNPDTRAVTVYRSRHDIRVRTGDDVIDGAEVVPGWTRPVKELLLSIAS